MAIFSKRERIIKRSVKDTVALFKGRTPKIYGHFFYGEFDHAPQNLVIWYLFETDAELETARTDGLCAELEELTVNNLISLGYPQEAFESASPESDFSVDRIAAEDCTDNEIQSFFDSLNSRKAKVSFATQEDIDKKANGDYRLYFQ